VACVIKIVLNISLKWLLLVLVRVTKAQCHMNLSVRCLVGASTYSSGSETFAQNLMFLTLIKHLSLVSYQPS
jgi:hypothetical protein